MALRNAQTVGVSARGIIEVTNVAAHVAPMAGPALCGAQSSSICQQRCLVLGKGPLAQCVVAQSCCRGKEPGAVC